MKTFRKDTGGYALLYVMVVVAVVCSIVMIISASAVKNYRAQQDSVERMLDKYAAVGEIEKFGFELLKITSVVSDTADAAGAQAKLIDAVEALAPEEDHYEFTADIVENVLTITLAYENIASVKAVWTAALTTETTENGSLYQITITVAAPVLTTYETGGAA